MVKRETSTSAPAQQGDSSAEIPLAELIRGAQGGSQPCFAQLVDLYGQRLFRYVYRKTGNAHDAEDLVQDAFVKAYRNLHRYKAGYKFGTWLFVIASRLTCSYYRRRRPPSGQAFAEPTSPSAYEVVAAQEENAGLWSLARTLPTNQYEALWLRYAENLSIKEIAQVMNKTPVHVKVLLFRARKQLALRWRPSSLEISSPPSAGSKETLGTPNRERFNRKTRPIARKGNR